MRIEEEKLEQFANDIMADVAVKRQKILAGVDKEIEKEYKEQESVLYTKAYETIQDGLKIIDLEKHEIIARAIMENKQSLLHKRTDIIDHVFETVREKLREYTKTDGYKDLLMGIIKKNLDFLNSDSVEVVINHTDVHFKEIIEKKFKCSVKVEIKQLDFIGGCKMLDKHKNIYLDDSFESRLESKREGFLLDCKIVVD